MVSELYCDGLGACIGECPVGAISLIEAEAQAYDEVATIERIAARGRNTIIAHLKHLAQHKQNQYIQQAVQWLRANGHSISPSDFMPDEATHKTLHTMTPQHHAGCPGSASHDFRSVAAVAPSAAEPQPSQLRQWPVQLHLLNPAAPYLVNSDLLVAADCTAFAVGDFHNNFLKGKTLAIACPKLDSNKEIYVEKIAEMIDSAKLNTITVMIMQVPCCGGLMQIIKMAQEKAQRKIPVKKIVISLQGEVLSEEWAMN
jgi:ferredoxin